MNKEKRNQAGVLLEETKEHMKILAEYCLCGKEKQLNRKTCGNKECQNQLQINKWKNEA